MKINFEEQLKSRLLDGEQKAFVETVELCKDMVYASAFKILVNKDDADDVMQDVFTLLYSKRSQIKFETNIPVWLYTSAVFISKRLIGRQRTVKNYQAKGDKMHIEDSDNDELGEIVLIELEKLPEKFREVLYQHFVLGFKTGEIAKNRGMKQSTVSMQINRGLTALKDKMTKRGYVVPILTIISAYSQSNDLMASSNVTVETIVQESIQCKHKIYRPGADSNSFNVFSAGGSSSLINSVGVWIAAVVIVVLGIYFYFDGGTQEQRHKSVLKQDLLVVEKPFSKLIWNNRNKNLKELETLSGKSAVSINSLTNLNHVSSLKASSEIYIKIPQSLPSIPVKFSFKPTNRIVNDFNVGMYVIDENGALPYKGYPAYNKIDRKKGGMKIVFYLVGKFKIMMINDSVVSIETFEKNFESYHAILRIRFIDFDEIKMEAMSPSEISNLNDLIELNKDKMTNIYEGNRLNK